MNQYTMMLMNWSDYLSAQLKPLSKSMVDSHCMSNHTSHFSVLTSQL